MLETDSQIPEAVVEIASLTRKFGDFVAVDAVSLTVKRG